jgi:integrase
LRFSDFSKLSSSNISDGLIRIKTQKTGTNVVIPLLPEVERILLKYNGNLPKAYCNQKMNEYLKLIGNKAEMFEKIEKNRLSGVKEVKSTLEKWQLICTHTARRSFATNMYKRGLDSIAIMQLTGHSTEKSFMTYIKISQEENARKILDYFKIRQESFLISA